MRYTLAQLLEYQNRRNDECDQSKIDTVIDDILAQMEKEVSLFPTITQVKLYCFTLKGEKCIHSMSELTLAERRRILIDLSNLGFSRVKFVNESDSEIIYLKISWGNSNV